MGNDISSSTTLFFQRSLSFVNVRLPDRIMRQRSASNSNRGAPRRCYRSGNDGRTSSLSSQDSQFPASLSRLNNNSPYGRDSVDSGRDPSAKSASRQIIGTKPKTSVRRSKSWRGSPTSRKKKTSAWNADSSKSSPGASIGDSTGLKRVRSPDLLINNTAVDEFDDFFERAAAAASRGSSYYDDTGRRISSSYYEEGTGRRRIFVDSAEDCCSVSSPPDSPVRPRTLTLGGVGAEDRLFLRVPSPASDDLTSSSYSNRSIGADSVADDQSESLPAKVSHKTAFISRKSSSFRRASGCGVTVRFADDDMAAAEENAAAGAGPSMEPPRTSLSPPSSSRLSPPSPNGLDIMKSGFTNNNRLISSSVSPTPVARNLKQSVSATELQKKRRADDRRKTIATARPAADPSPPPTMTTANGKKSPSATARSASCSSIPLLTPAQITLIRQHWNQTYITKGPSVLGTHVFQRACFKVPAIKEVFNHVEFTDKMPNVDLVSKQHAKNVALIVDEIVKNLDHLDVLVPRLYEIGRKHSFYHNKGFHANYWAVFAESFIDCTLEWGEKIRRVEEARKAWAILIAFVVDRMKVGFQDGKRDLTRQKISGGESTQSDGGCGSPPKL